MFNEIEFSPAGQALAQQVAEILAARGASTNYGGTPPVNHLEAFLEGADRERSRYKRDRAENEIVAAYAAEKISIMEAEVCLAMIMRPEDFWADENHGPDRHEFYKALRTYLS